MALHPKVIDLTLDRVWRLLRALGNPQDRLPSVIHLAGTNGKGSTQAMIRAGLEGAGQTVHAYTSPHLAKFHERIRIAGELISEAALTELLDRCYSANGGETITYFEITTCAALQGFAEHAADYTLLETGMGGRLDVTNVVNNPAACVLTPIDLDHQQFLGDTLAKIAFEKAGIIKQGIPVTISEYQPEISDIFIGKANENQAAIQFANEDIRLKKVSKSQTLELDLESTHFGDFKIYSPYVGTYQINNIMGVLAWCSQLDSMKIIKFNKDKVELGIKNSRINTQLKGRFEMISNDPKIIADTAHNESGIRLLMDQIKSCLKVYGRRNYQFLLLPA